MRKKKTSNIYTKVTQNFIKALKTGAPPWRKPWADSSLPPGFPVNAETERKYSGINVTILWAAAIAQGFEHDRWLTFNQISKSGGKIRRGEKGTIAVLYRKIKIDKPRLLAANSEEASTMESQTYKVARAFTLFNVAQCNNLPKKIVTGNYFTSNDEPRWESHKRADELVKSCGAKVRHTAKNASYSPKHDIIQMPPKSAFNTTGGYYSTLMHELTHWTGHESRLNRIGIVESQCDRSHEYAMEELIAEIGSAFLCADYRIRGELCHEAYVLQWIKILENDPKAIFTSSALAWKARNYLFELTGLVETQQVEYKHATSMPLACAPTDIHRLRSSDE